jgi:hypothetical protein
MKGASYKTHVGEEVLGGEFDQIAHNLALRVERQRDFIKHRSAAHRSTREEKRKLAALAKALERIRALRSQLA